ncbi:RagB/SusD family nutrient uptake outer membrane protein [Robertkochia marina]|uniref:RagB/SusD family nutrient uptake outer membrane protein n=1 Tax=Robertkochia marina TaxID=1227945 RepID=A0A4S3M4Z6_9FLAO|nr:SusD/RagB family nutrient-binding outer membrane lipoprotein [Robertkochia marina]THD69915.1 RagB/SusD family nutrient uptake outer membrane protein [Robertkochia marina]TRZ46737.1 RagB/SusD family nutrient uptake outer membrane protein [Robertkochia marina]
MNSFLFKNLRPVIFTVLFFLLMSCSNYNSDTTTTPNDFTSMPGEEIIGQIGLAVAELSSGHASRIGSTFSDQISFCARCCGPPYESYTVSPPDFDVIWSNAYTDGIANSVYVREYAVANGDTILEGVAMILQAMLFGEMAALFGDIPFSEAGNPLQYPHPRYDPQHLVFSGIQQMLSEAIAKVDSAPVSISQMEVFTSNEARWASIAHSLKARYYLITKDYNNALLEAQRGIGAPNGGLLINHSNTEGAKNLYFQYTVEQRKGHIGTCNNPLLFRFLNDTQPRIIYTPGDQSRLYHYFDVDASVLNTNPGGLIAADANFPVISWVETKLIEAEAAARTGGDALTPFNEVRAHLEATYEGHFPISSTTDTTLLITEILEEKYISMPLSIQTFHDARRTNDILGTLKGDHSTIPQRFLYPQAEIDANENFPGIQDLFTPTSVNQ